MLILTRRVGETLMIGDEVSVTVLGVKGNQVRLGVNAPKDIAVHREEIYQRILHERVGGGLGLGMGMEYPTPERSPYDFPVHNMHGQQPRQHQNFEQPQRMGFERERIGRNTNRQQYPNAMNHLENQNRGFGSHGNSGFNHSYDSFDDDYYNR